MAKIKAADFDDRMTLVEHLDELRSRLVFSAWTLGVAMALCFWQNEILLDLAAYPLPEELKDNLTTLSPGEPFVTTLTLSAYGAILLSLPILLYHAYAYLLPAFSPSERRVVLPLLLMVPFLFIAGVVFAFFVVAPAAIDFLLGFNADEFNTQLRAREYYGFFALSLISVGVLFQIPVGVLAVTRLGIVTPDQLAENRRYGVLAIAVLAMLLPGTDPVTMLLAMVPLLFLFEFSIRLARTFGKARDGGSDLARTGGPSGRAGEDDPLG